MKRIIPVKIEGVNVKVSISFKESRLSIVGNSSMMSGQIWQYLHGLESEDYQLQEGWTEEMYRKLLDIWKRWHLNDMRAGCSHQRAMSLNIYEHLGKPCPICGYKYGCGWIFEPVPDEVIEWLFNLP